VPETCRELKNKINKYIISGASSWFSVRNKDRIAATMYPLGIWFVSGICVWINCVKETMMI
jgi:hypothetical protein